MEEMAAKSYERKEGWALKELLVHSLTVYNKASLKFKYTRFHELEE